MSTDEQEMDDYANRFTEPKKEKPMAKLEINTQLFDGLSLHQRINALLLLQNDLNKALENRIESQSVAGDNPSANGICAAYYVHETAIKDIMKSLIDSTVEKFGGGA